jgi:hypothetical protein
VRSAVRLMSIVQKFELGGVVVRTQRVAEGVVDE